MPILRLESFTPLAGRSLPSAAGRLWIDSAAWWPCSTAQMMFFGPCAASPPKNTCGSVD
jgi:hypothetical protein